MDRRTDAQIIEIFHLLFLQVLSARGREWFILKGGANLRYFFDSVRYSNDVDLDFFHTPSWQVERTVDRVLSGAALAIVLRQQELAIGESTKPKQTDTTRRWKIGLARHGTAGELVRTKIEFSDRGATGAGAVYETVPSHIVNSYGLRPATLSHYGLVGALEQKIAALALRSETKARDVFDLELLLRRRRAHGSILAVDVRHVIPAAHKAREVSYASFRSEVIPFLEPEIATLYDREEEWLRMRSVVSDELVALSRSSMDGGAS